MMKAPNFSLEMKAPRNAVIELYDEIGPAWAGMIDPSVVSRAINEAGPLDNIEVRINSPGGSVFHGVAIHNLLKNHPAKVHMRVDGVAASSASVVLMAGDTIEVPKNAMVMIHDPAMVARGGEAEMVKAAELLAKIKAQIIDTYAKRTGKPAEAIAKMMTDETWMNGEEAVANGFATQVTSELPLPKAVAASTMQAVATYSESYSRAPENFSSLYSLAMCATSKEIEPMPEAKTAEQIAAEAQAAAEIKAKADAEAIAKHAAEIANAVEAERNRAADITAACEKAGKPAMASKFIADKTSLADVQARLFDVMCQERKPADDTSERQTTEADPHAAYKAEYAKNPHLKATMTEEAYVETRLIDDGKATLQKLG